MVELKEIDLINNSITFKDGTIVLHKDFESKWRGFWNGRIAGETITHSDVERFMKRGSTKNMSQLMKAKKTEGYLEASLGKKMDPGMLKFIIVMVVVAAVACIAILLLKQMGLF